MRVLSSLVRWIVLMRGVQATSQYRRLHVLAERSYLFEGNEVRFRRCLLQLEQHEKKTYTLRGFPVVTNDNVIAISLTLRLKERDASSEERAQEIREWIRCHTRDESQLVMAGELEELIRRINAWLDKHSPTFTWDGATVDRTCHVASRACITSR